MACQASPLRPVGRLGHLRMRFRVILVASVWLEMAIFARDRPMGAIVLLFQPLVMAFPADITPSVDRVTGALLGQMGASKIPILAERFRHNRESNHIAGYEEKGDDPQCPLQMS